jgi:hypothetical protein
MKDSLHKIEMPKYRSHKQVWALKIKAVHHKDSGGALLEPHEGDYKPFEVDHGYILKHNPVCGGYYVKYQDGYESYSPAEAFEEGYVLL